MIRLIQRRLIIPRGDTGNFSIPVITNRNTGDVAIFSIFDPLTQGMIFQKQAEAADDVLTIEFNHNDTVNLPVGQFVWDIKYYVNPVFADGKLVDGEEIDSYYAAFTLPICEIRQTGDSLVVSDRAPQGTLAPDQIDLLTAAVNEAKASVMTDSSGNININGNLTLGKDTDDEVTITPIQLKNLLALLEG